MRRTSALIFAGFLLAALVGCGPTIKAGFDSPEPAARNAAIVQAAASNDQRAVPDLVRMLDSDDPATRLLAIDALERITGERNGYDFAAPEYQREQAVDRWEQWVKDRGLAPAEPVARSTRSARP